MSVHDRVRCTHTTLDGIVEQFELHEVSGAAVDEMVAAIDKVLAALPYPQTHPSLIISTVGTQPIAHTFNRMRDLARKYPKRNQNRIAMILPDNSLLRVVEALMRPLGSTVRFFKDSQREEAIAWLKANLTPKQ